jgi:aryl-alcohol dehydrogenase-like predicted oxidoreductase
MRYRQLGSTGVLISEIGFGTWGLGGNHGGAIAYGRTNDDVSLAALRSAFRNGVTFYDTADLYGFGHSECLLGKAFAKTRADVFIATKAGFLTPTIQNFTPAYLELSLRRSLDRMQTSYGDLFLLHNPPRETLESDPSIWTCLERMKSRGQVRSIGISVRSPDDGLALVADFAPDVIEVNYNLADQRAVQNGLLDMCAERGVGVIVRTPLCFGFLTGAYAGNMAFDTADHRSRWSTEQRDRWVEAQEIFRDGVAEIEGQTPAQFALRFCLSHPGVSTAIPGMLTVDHVEENLRASDLGPLPADDLERIRRVYEGQEFFLGK